MTDVLPSLQIATLRPRLASLGSQTVLAQCAWCERVRIGTSWVAETELEPTAELEWLPRSHTICAACAGQWPRFALSA